MDRLNLSKQSVLGRKHIVISVNCGVSALNVRVVPTVEFDILRIHRVALGGRLVPHNSKASNELSKYVRICDAEIWAKSHFVNRDLATNDGLAEQDEAEIDRHDNLLSELFRNLVDNGIVILLVSRSVDADQCAKIIPAQLWVDGINFGHAFERRFEKSRGATVRSKVIAHNNGDMSERSVGRKIETSIDASRFHVNKFLNRVRNWCMVCTSRNFEVTELRQLRKLLVSLPKGRLVIDSGDGREHAAAGFVLSSEAGTDGVAVGWTNLGTMMATRGETARSNFFRQVLNSSGSNIAASSLPERMSIIVLFDLLSDCLRERVRIGSVGRKTLHVISCFIHSDFIFVNV